MPKEPARGISEPAAALALDSRSMEATAPASAPVEPPGAKAKVLLRRVGIAVVLIVILLIPAIVMVVATAVFTGHAEGAGTYASIPALATMAAVAAGGRDLGLRVAIVLMLLGPLSIVAGANPVSGAALMALMCLMVGLMSRWGLHRAGLMVPVMVAWTLISPPPWGVKPVVDRMDTTFLLWMALIFFVGGLFPVLVLPFVLRKAHLPSPKPNPRNEAIVYTIIITVLAAGGTYYMLDHPKLFGGAFFVATVLVLAPIGEADILKPTIVRVVATVAGSVLVALLLAAVSSLTVLYLIGLLIGAVAIVAKFSRRPALYYILMVPTAACLNALSVQQVGQLSDQRVIDNLVGGVLVLLASAAAIGYSRWEQKRGNSTTDEHVVARVPAAA